MTDSEVTRALSERDTLTDLEIKAGLSERDTLLVTILGEARGEEIEGRIAVGCVIRNRARDPKRWPDDIKGVCLERWQFSCWNDTDANYRPLMKLAAALVSDHAIRTSSFTPEAIFTETRWLVDGILGGQVRDRVGASNHYLTRQKWETDPPSWARGKSPTAFINRHVFFKL